MNTGQNLSKIRKIKGRKQADLANQLGMTQSNYSKYERKPKLSVEFLEKAAKELDVEPDDILHFDEKFVFNIQEQQGSNSNGLIVNNFPPKLQEHYDTRIKDLQEENRQLRTMMDDLHTKMSALLAEKKN